LDRREVFGAEQAQLERGATALDAEQAAVVNNQRHVTRGKLASYVRQQATRDNDNAAGFNVRRNL